MFAISWERTLKCLYHEVLLMFLQLTKMAHVFEINIKLEP